MNSNKQELRDFIILSKVLSIPMTEIRRAVYSFFDDIVVKADSLPFAVYNKIYKKEPFSTYQFYQNIPSIGRIGTSYSRYLAWKRNESKQVNQTSRCNCSDSYSQEEIEKLADALLHGKSVIKLEKQKHNTMYSKVWIVSANGKKLAKQIIKKD